MTEENKQYYIEKIKAREMKISDVPEKYLDDDMHIIASSYFGEAFKGVKNKTEEVCFLAAIKNPDVLEFIENQTDEMCMAAMNVGGWALPYVKKQTDKICLAAVTNSGVSLEYVKNKTDEICLAAVKQDGWALDFVENQTDEICLEAVRQDGQAIQFVKNKTEEICLEAVKQTGLALEFIETQTEEMIEAAINSGQFNIGYMKNQTEEMCIRAVAFNGWQIMEVKKQTVAVYKEAIKIDVGALIYVDPEIYIYDKEEVIKAYDNIVEYTEKVITFHNDDYDRFFTLLAKSLIKLSDEELINSVNVDLKYIMESDQLAAVGNELINNIKQKVKMLELMNSDNEANKTHNKKNKSKIL